MVRPKRSRLEGLELFTPSIRISKNRENRFILKTFRRRTTRSKEEFYGRDFVVVGGKFRGRFGQSGPNVERRRAE